MMLKRNEFGSFEIRCEQCGSNDIFGADFTESIEEAKDNGWIIFKDKTEGWIHFCSLDCRDTYLK